MPHTALLSRAFRRVLVGFYCDVVAEPFRLLVGIRVAADVDEQRRVVDGDPSLFVEPQAVGEA